MTIISRTASLHTEWDSHFVNFLSNRRKYRLFGWEFGPTLLDYLHRWKEGGSPDYLKNGMVVTWIAASLVSLAVYTFRRGKAKSVAFQGLGVFLFGMLITVAIDCQKTKKKQFSHAIPLEDCVRLLDGLGEMPQYWWWPWSKKIMDVQITKSQTQRVYKYNQASFVSRLLYAIATDVALHELCLTRHVYLCQSQKLIERIEVKKFNLNDLMQRIFHIDDPSSRMKEVLDAINQIDWLPLDLDTSLEKVRMGIRIPEEHETHFKERIKQIRQLSLLCNPNEQELIELLLFRLERTANPLEEAFEIRDMLIAREEKRTEADNRASRAKMDAFKKDIQESERQAKELKRQIEEAKRRTEEAERKAQELAKKRAAVDSYWIHISTLDRELKRIVDQESRDRIMQTTAGCKCPQEATRTIIEAIRANREEVIRESKVSDAILEAAVGPFLA